MLYLFLFVKKLLVIFEAFVLGVSVLRRKAYSEGHSMLSISANKNIPLLRALIILKK